MDPVAPWVSDRDESVSRFLAESRFALDGGVMTDLDGTAVHEFEGRAVIPRSVSHALTELRRLERPIVLNTLRFPMNVIETFGREWYEVSGAPLPLVSLNGSVVGHLHEGSNGHIEFQEALARPVPAALCEAVLADVEKLLSSGIEDLLLFYYPHDWRAGERLWTPFASRHAELRGRYSSAAGISSEPLVRLASSLATCEPCMLLVLVDATDDHLMSYQHARPGQFVTAEGVDKASGAEAAARLVGFDLGASVGAGDTIMDSFLASVGLALRVGAPGLPFEGRHATVDLPDSLALGEFWFRMADLMRRNAR
jgi:hypothetical protein